MLKNMFAIMCFFVIAIEQGYTFKCFCTETIPSNAYGNVESTKCSGGQCLTDIKGQCGTLTVTATTTSIYKACIPGSQIAQFCEQSSTTNVSSVVTKTTTKCCDNKEFCNNAKTKFETLNINLVIGMAVFLFCVL